MYLGLPVLPGNGELIQVFQLSGDLLELQVGRPLLGERHTHKALSLSVSDVTTTTCLFKFPDGRSNLLIQNLCKVEVTGEKNC